MTEADFEKLAQALEQMVDAFTVREVLNALVMICDEKAEHVAVNWQDATSAKWWANASNQIENAKDKLGGE
jgi:hypothetical protein